MRRARSFAARAWWIRGSSSATASSRRRSAAHFGSWPRPEAFSVGRSTANLRHNPGDIVMSVLSLRCFRFCAGMVLLTGALSAQGADYCVGNTPQLRAALDAAAASSEDDVIRLERNSYPLVDSSVFLSPIKGSLVLRGGYASGCPLIGRSLDAATTRILSSTPQERAISLYAAGDDLEIDGLSFEDLLAVSLYSTGNQPTASSGQIWVRRSRFIGNRRALKVFSAHKDVRIENSVFLDNESLNGHGVDDDVAIRVQHVSGAQAPISVDVLFNTVLGNRRGIW